MGTAQAGEGDAFVFTVTASHPSINAITGTWSLLAGTANAADFGGTFPTGTFTIPAGSTTAIITFSSLEDVVVEGNETFTLVLDNIANAQGGPVSAVGTILNDDFEVSLDTSVVMVGEGAGTAQVTVSLSAAHTQDVIVTYRTLTGTAGIADFSGTASATVTIPAGSTSAVISIPITNDTIFDGGNESFQVQLVSAVDAGSHAVGVGQALQTVTIVDNEVAPTLTMTPVSQTEGGMFTFTVTASHGAGVPITGNWSLLAGTANAADFGGTFPSGTFTIPAGSTTATITFSTIDDSVVEPHETFMLVLDGLVNAQPGPVSTTGTILNNDFAVSLDAAVITVNEGAGNAVATVTLTSAYAHDITITYRTLVGTASAADYTGTASSTVTIPAGSTSATITIPIIDDALYDGGNENFQIEILGAVDSASNVIPVGQATQTVTIIDNDAAPVLSMAPVSQTEGGLFTFTVTASRAADSPITGNWSLLAGTANAADFGGTFPSGTFTIPAGATSTTITFSTIDDSLVEANETFTLVLDGLVNAQSGPVSATGTILNNDYAVSLDTAVITVNEGAGNAVATVTLTSAYAHDITITYRTVAGTATAADYTGTASSTVTIPAGGTSATITIPIIDDALYDGGNESFQIEILGAVDSASNIIPVGQATQTVTIVDNDAAPVLSMAPVSQTEGGLFTFTVTASRAADSPITGNWSLLAGTANAADFGGTFPSGTFTIPAGSTTATISFSSVDDVAIEGNETFTLVLDSLVNAQPGPVSTTGTILNNDFAVTITPTPVTVNEGDGNAQIGVSINGAHTQDIIITYRTVSGTASGADYTATSLSTITIPAGSTSATILVPITNDAIYEGSESFQIEIISAADSGGQNIAVTQATQTVTIIDNEIAPTLTMANVSQTEGGLFTFTVTASHASSAPITGTWAVQAGVANAADFGGVLPSGTFTIAPGSTTAVISFTSTQDSAIEGNETFGLLLDNITGAQTTPVLATGTILNDDFGVNIDTATATVGEGDGTHAVVFTISAPYAQDVTITYRTVAGTAGASDFTMVSSATVTILAGQTSATANIAITNDVLYDQGDETFVVEIVSARDASLNNIPVGQATQTVTIVDNETAPTLTIAPVSALEGSVMTFTITASHAADGPITGNWNVLAATADAADFGGTLPTGTFTIPAGATSVTISVPTSQDSVAEANETFTLQLTSINGAQSGAVSAIGTIINDDYEIHFAQTTDSINENGGTHTARVDLSAAYAHDITVTYRTVAVSANGTDYTAVATGTITIPAGQYFANISIPITDDSVYEGNETFRIELLSATDTNGVNIPLSNNLQTVTIIDNETTPVLSVADQSVVEGGTFTYTLNLSNPTAHDVTGNWQVLAGTANAADFGGILPSGTFIIPAGSTSATITISTVNDTIAEQLYETFSLRLYDITHTSQTTVVANGTIEDNDVQVYVTSTGQTVSEGAGSASVTFQLNRVYAQDITVNYRTVNGTANGLDYTGVAAASVVIPAGTTSVTINIPITDDNLYEAGTESFSVEIVSAQDSFASPISVGTNNSHTVNITDNDAPPTLTLTPASAVEGNNIVFTVTTNRISSQDITGTWSVGSGTATVSDFGGTFPTGTFTIPAGSLTATITVPTTDDVAQEGTENFTLTIDNISGAQSGPVSTTGTILDNEMAVSMNLTSSSTPEGAGTVSITISLSQVHTHDVIVGYRTITGTADGSDFIAVPTGTITIPAGSLSANIVIGINDDTMYDGGNETFQVQLLSAEDTNSQPISVGSSTHTVTIIDNETAPTITMGDLVRTEGGTFTFTITASGTSDSPITGNWNVLAGTATAADFTGGVLPSGTFTIPVGMTSTTLTFGTFDDVLQEGSETFTVNLTNIAGADPTPVTANGIIQDNELSVAFALGSSVVNENSGVAPITIVLSQPMAKDVTIYYRTLTGTAGATDFTQVTNSAVIIPAGQTSATINIGINDDLIYDGAPETFQVQLISAQDSDGGVVPVSIINHQVVINDNDPAPTVTLSDMTINEGGAATFTITRHGLTDESITGNWQIQAGTANAADFGGTLPSGTFTLPAGVNSITVSVSTYDDLLSEGNETFSILIDNMTNTSTTSVTSNGIILDNELSVSFSAPTGTVTENGIGYNATIQLNQVYAHDVTVTYSTVAGTAGAADFVMVTNQTVVILAGQTSVQVPITITDDFIVEGSESFQIRIDSAVDANAVAIPINTGTQTVTITDDDINLQISFATPSTSVVENAGSASIRINLNQVHSEDIIIRYNTSNGTATAGSDYVGTVGTVTVTIPAGQSFVNIPVTITDDIIYEGPSENFNINIVSAQDQSGRAVTVDGATIHQVTIVENDAVLFLQFEQASSTVAEEAGAQSARVVLNRVHSSDVTITYRTVNGTATHGSDYTGTGVGTATVTIPAGQTSVLIPYAVIDDNIHEYAPSENFTIELVSAVDAGSVPVVLNGTVNHNVIITDSDPLPTLSINAAPSPENVDYVFTINLSGRASQDVTGTWTFLPGTATAADFNYGAAMPSGTFTILAGSTVATITVQTLDDSLSEGYEDFTIRLDNITGANATPVLATGQLVDDELIIGFDSTTALVIEGASHTATIGMSFATLNDVVVTYEIVGIDATAGADFIAGTGSVTIAAGQTTASVLIQTLQDSLNEANEQFKIRLTGVSTTGPLTPQIAPAYQEQIITIDDDELDPTITMNVPGFVNENGGAQLVTLERSTNSGVTNSVNVRFDGVGFTVTYAGVTYNPGQVFTVAFVGFFNSQNITFTPINNATYNGDSTVTVTLSDPVNARLPTTSYAFSLLDDEAPTTSEYNYGAPGPIIDGKVHGQLNGDDGRNVLSIGETVVASIIRNVVVDPKSGIDQVRMQTQTGVHHILDNEVLAGADGRAIIELTTGAAGDSIVSGNTIRGSAKGDDIVSLSTAGGAVGAVSSNRIYLAEGTFVGTDGTNDLTLSALNGNAGSVVTQNSVGVIGNNIVVGGDGADLVTVRTAGNTAGTWSGQVATLATGTYSDLSAVLLKDGGYIVAYQNNSGATGYMILNMDGTVRVAGTVLQSSVSYAPEMAVLNNGNIAIVYYVGSSNQDIRMKIIAPDGATVLADTAVIIAGTTIDPKITAMVDGGFLMTWYDSAAQTVTVARYNASGMQSFTETITQTGGERHSSVTALQNGGYVLAWSNNSSGSFDVYFQRYNADNSKAGTITTVANGSGNEFWTQITTLKDGSFAVVWLSASTQDGVGAVFSSIYNADGTLRTGDIMVSRTQTSGNSIEKITPLFDGGFVVTYSRANIDFGGASYSNQDSYMTRFDKNGVMVGDEIRLGSSGAGYIENYANIIEMRDGNLMAVYYDSGTGGLVSRTLTPPGASIIQGNDFTLGDGTNRLIVDAQSGTGREGLNDTYDQNSGGSGSVISGNRVVTGNGEDEILFTASSGVGGNAVVNTAGSSYAKQWSVDSTTPAGAGDQGVMAVGLADGRFAIVWSEVAGGYDVFMQLYDRNGSAIGNQIVVRDDGTSNLTFPVITALADGGYVVSWQNNNVNAGIQYVVYNADGTVRVPVATLDTGAGDDISPDIIALADGGFVIAWSETNTASYSRIRIARFDEDGQAIGDQAVITPPVSTHNLLVPEVVATPDGGYIVGWRNTTTNYFEWQRFDAAGRAVTAVIQSPSALSNYGGEMTLLANGNLLVTQHTSATNAGKVIIYNQAGQVVQIVSDPGSYMYRSQTMALPDGGFLLVYTDNNSYPRITRYTADGAILGSSLLLGSTITAANAFKSLSISQVGEDSFVVAWTTGTTPYASLFKFSDTFNVGGDASVVEGNNIATHGNNDVITLSTSGGTGGQAAESGGGTYGSQLVTQAGDASVVQNNIVDAGDGNDIVNLSATGGNSNYAKIDGKTAQILNNTVITGTGNDQVNITASGGNGNVLSNRVSGNVIDMGDGNDSLTSYSTHFLRNTVTLGAGDNSANITAEYFNDNRLTAGNGADSIIVSGVRGAHNNNINLGAGNDSFSLTTPANYLRVFSGIGAEIDDATRVTGMTGHKTVALSNGNYVTTWYESVSGQATNVYAQVFNGKGQAVTSIISVAVSSNAENYPSVTALAGGQFAIGWTDSGLNNSYIKKYGSDGVQIGATYTVPDNNYSTVQAMEMATLSNGKIVVVQIEPAAATGGYYNVHHMILNADMTVAKAYGGTTSMFYTGGHVYYPSVTATADGGYIIAATYTANAYSYMQKYDAAGNYLWQAGGQTYYSGSNYDHPSKVLELSNGNILQYGGYGSYTTMTIYNAAGTYTTGMAPNGNYYYPEVEVLDGGTFALYTTNGGSNLYKVIYNSAGSVVVSQQLVLTAPTTISQIEIDKVAGNTVLSYAAGDKIYQQIMTNDVMASVTGLELDLGEGTNNASVTTNYITSMDLSSGDGDDTITLAAYARAIQNKISMGNGTNVLNVTGGEFDIWSITGGINKDTVSIASTASANRLTIDLKAGVNETTIAAATTVNNLTYTGGADADKLTVTAGSTLNNAIIALGAGINNVDMTLTGATAGIATFGLTSGNDNDTVKIVATAAINNATINLGAGTNNIDLQSTASNMNALNLTTTGGADTVLLRAAGTMNNAVIALGAGVNDLDIILTGASGSISTFGLTTGDDADTVDITTSRSISGATLDLGGGTDIVNVTAQTSITNLTLTLGAGNNTADLKANGGVMATLGVTALGGNDSLITRSTGNMDNATINLGDGTNAVNMRSTGGTMNVAQITTGIGDDTITLQSSGNMNNATILTSSGNDILSMTAGGTMNDVIINLGTGDNAATFSGTISNMQISAGSNNDILNFTGGQVNSATINLGIGDSTLTVTSGVAAFNGVSYTTGAGRDNVIVSTAAAGNSFSLGSGEDMLTLRSIGNNSIDLGIQTNVLDTLVLTAAGAHSMASLGGQVKGVEMVDIRNTQTNTLTVDRGTALQADNYGGQKILFIKGDAADTVNIIKGPGTVTNTGATQEFDGVTYRVIEHNEGTPVFFFIQQGVTVTVDGGPLTFDNPIAADLAALDVDTSSVTISKSAEAESQPTAAAPEGARVITYALFGGAAGDERMGGPIAQAASLVFAFYQAEMAARGINIIFVEKPQSDDGSMFGSDADITIGLGSGILGHLLDNPDSVLGISAGQEGEAYSMIMNAPHAPDGLNAANLAGDIFLSDAFLKLAALDPALGGGLHEGSLAYYVLMQEVGHSLGLEEKTDEELAQDGYDASVAHQTTTTDETVDGLDSLDDLAGMIFASTPGQAALDQLAQTMQQELNAQTDSGTDWMQPDYATIADLIAQFSHDPDSVVVADQFQSSQSYQEFLTEFMQTHADGLNDPAMGGQIDALLNWAQDYASTLPSLPVAANDAVPSSLSGAQGPSIEQISAEVASVPVPDDQETVHA